MERHNAILQEIKDEYWSHLQWLVPFPGDWHILFNYQKVLLKPYADAGISTLASAAGYRAETLTKLLNASNFKKTHDFLLQLFEALYRFFLSLYIDASSTKNGKDYSEILSTSVAHVLKIFNKAKCDSDLETIRNEVAKTIPSGELSYKDFSKFMESLALKQDIIKFWYQFLFKDCLSYISLFIAIRYRNWDLRVGSIKQLAAIFSAYDRPMYQKLIPRHVHDLCTLPEHFASSKERLL